MESAIHLCELRRELLNSPGNILVQGGPGSGKTTIALLKAAHEIASGSLERGQRILFLSFARATIARVAEQASKNISVHDLSLLEINTYHGFAWNLLRSHGYLLRKERGIKLLSPPDAAARMAFINKDNRLAEMERLFKEEGLLHFDLFAENALALLTQSQSLLRIVCSVYPFIIVDEFQDTDESEWKLIQVLGKVSRIMSLADPEQRIYEFRGASPNRIADLKRCFMPCEFDFRFDNYRSDGTDITKYGNDLLNQTNKTRTYRNVKIKHYSVTHNTVPHLSLKYEVLNNIVQLRRSNLKEWSLGILVPSNQLMMQVSGYLNKHTVKLPSINHEVAFDAEAACLAAILIASLLEGCENTNQIVSVLICRLYTYICGHRGSKQLTADDVKLANILQGFKTSTKVTGSIKKQLYDAIYSIAENRIAFNFSGDPANDWESMRKLLADSDVKIIKQIAQDATYLRFLHKGSSLRSHLNEQWRKNDNYVGAENHVRAALIQEQFSLGIKPPLGVHVMTIHKSKGKEFTRVIVYEGIFGGRVLTGEGDSQRKQSLLALRVAVTRAQEQVTILTPQKSPCPFL